MTIPTNTSVTLETLDSQTTRLQDDSWKSGDLLIFYTFHGLYVKVGMQALKLNRIFRNIKEPLHFHQSPITCTKFHQIRGLVEDDTWMNTWIILG